MDCYLLGWDLCFYGRMASIALFVVGRWVVVLYLCFMVLLILGLVLI